MRAIAGYQITTKLYESSKSLVYRGCRLSDKFPVILKVLKQEYPPPEEFPVHLLKIDRSFTQRIGVQNQDTEIIRTILTLALQGRDAEIVGRGDAETSQMGIETPT